MHPDVETQSRGDRSSAPPRTVVAFWDDKSFSFELPELGTAVIGRAPECDLVLDHPSVSRNHLRLHAGSPLTLEDLGSRNGTVVRGLTIPTRQRVHVQTGDVVECGDVTLVLRERRADGEDDAPGAVTDLVVGPEGMWFQTHGARINLGRRGAMRRVLFALVEMRLAGATSPATVATLLAAGWPGEKMLHEAGVARLYTTVQRLRALGLKSIIVTRDDGCVLDPGVNVHMLAR